MVFYGDGLLCGASDFFNNIRQNQTLGAARRLGEQRAASSLPSPWIILARWEPKHARELPRDHRLAKQEALHQIEPDLTYVSDMKARPGFRKGIARCEAEPGLTGARGAGTLAGTFTSLAQPRYTDRRCRPLEGRSLSEPS